MLGIVSHAQLSTVTIALSASIAICCLTNAAEASRAIQNAGFEESKAGDGWEVAVYGAASTIDLDSEIKREGQHSLRISARSPSDTALGQEVTLEPNRWYRLRGWVRTQALKPGTARTYGSLQVQKPRGAGLIASGAGHAGDTDWTEDSVYFKAPLDGRVRVCVFFAGFGKGTGTAWFDGLRLDHADVTHGSLKITEQPLFAAKISPLQYGQFVEYLCDLVPAMWSEKVSDGGFEGSKPYILVFLKEKDMKEQPWYPSGAMNRAQYTLDKEIKLSGEVSKKIAVGPGAPCRVGISQDGIYLEKGATLVFKCFLRGDGVPVQVKLHDEGEVVASRDFEATGDWKKYQARLVPSRRVLKATLSIEFRGPATLWIDNVSLMPERTVGGWRSDVVEATRALKPGVIRFGGSALEVPSYGDFEWRDTIGPVDTRKPWRAWGGIQPLAAGLEEFVQFCRAVGAEPLMCVRFSNRSLADAAAQVEYFNGSAGTPMGALRAKNGHPEPYRIKYWQVGNEVVSADYDAKLAAFCEAMKKVDPSIVLLSSFPTANSIRNAGAFLDYVAPHHYSADRTFMDNDLTNIKKMIRENASGRPIKIAVTEWNTTAGDPGPRRAMLWTLDNALACSRYRNLMHRHADTVEIANRSNLANSFCSGIIQTDTHRLYKTPTYYADWLYANHAGETALKIQSSLPDNVGLDASATLSEDRNEVVVFAVNDTLEEMTRAIDFSAFGNGKAQRMSVWTLSDREEAKEPDVTNSFSDPDRIVAREKSIRTAAKFEHRFPALSLTVLKWRVNGRDMR